MICGGSRTAASHAARPDPAKASTRLTQRENGMEVSSSGDSVCACGLVACVCIYIYIYMCVCVCEPDTFRVYLTTVLVLYLQY